jgi:threonine/homoserine/homoserine lactone efflux protein
MTESWLLALKGVLIGIAVAAPIGAVGILVIRRALAERPWAGFVAGLGAALGDGSYAGIAGFGLTAVTQFLETWQHPLRIGGGIVIIVMGVLLLLHMRAWHSVPTGAPAGTARESLMGRRKSFLAALALTLGNPIALVAFIAIFAGIGLDPDEPSFADTWVLVVSIAIGSALWFLTLSLSAYAVSQRYGERAARLFDGFAAVLLIVLGIVALAAPMR